MSLGCLAGADRGAVGLATARPNGSREIQDPLVLLLALLVALHLRRHLTHQLTFKPRG